MADVIKTETMRWVTSDSKFFGPEHQARVVDVETFGRRFVVAEPASLAPELARHTLGEFTDHEPVLERWVRGIKAGDVVIDAGAQFGSYAMPALAAGAFLVAYEPSDAGWRILNANVALNAGREVDVSGDPEHDDLTAYERAVVRRLGLWDDSEYPAALQQQVFGTHYPSDGAGLRTVTLDADLAALSLLRADPMPDMTRVDWIKMDIEGAELGALRGALRTLQRHHPTLVVELHEGVSQDPNDEVSRYPERVGANEAIDSMLDGLGYHIEYVKWDVSRLYAFARHPSRT